MLFDTCIQASRSALHKAAINGQYKTVKILLGSGEDVDRRDEVVRFPFSYWLLVVPFETD